MPEAFLHGVDVVEIDSGPRPIQTARASVIGLVGTAPDADAGAFPLNVPVLIAGKRGEAAKLGALGTLPAAMDDVFDQAGAWVVVVRVAQGISEANTLSNVIGGVDADTGQYQGVQALLAAESELGVTPRILVAPEFSQNLALATEMISVAERLRGVVVADGPNTTDSAAIAQRNHFGSDRLYLVDPWVRVWDPQTNAEAVRPASARVAGVIAKSDDSRGFWCSPSNQSINGIVGTARSVDFVLGDTSARANLLNEQAVTTIIQHSGFRLWGNRSCIADPKWSFLSVRRTADMIHESLLRAHLWAVDRNITKTYLDDVLEGVNAYLRHLRAVGAIINGSAWADPELNTQATIAAGKVYIDFDFTPPFPAEHIVFRSHLVNDYLTEILPG